VKCLRAALQFSKDGEVFMSACQDRHIRLYDTRSWNRKKDIVARDVGWSVIDTDYSPDQRWLIYSSWSDYVHFCNIHGDYESHEPLDFRPEAQRFCLFSIKFSPDSNEICGGSSDRHLYIFDLDRKERTLKVEAHNDDINTVAFLDQTGQTIVSGSDDYQIKLWDRRMLGQRGMGCVGVLLGHVHGITHVSSKGDGRYLISNGKDQCVKLWDVRNMISAKDAERKVITIQHSDYRYNSHRTFNVGRHPSDQSIMTYRGHRVLQTLIRAYFSPAFSTGCKYIYTGSYDGTAYIYDVLSGNVVNELKGHEAIIRDLSWHPFEPTLVTTSWDGTAWEWSAEEGNSRSDSEVGERGMRRRRYLVDDLF